jgi:hypothetical protein
MEKIISLVLLLIATPCYAGSNILNLTGSYNTITTTQIGDPSINFSATNLNNSSVTFDQEGGGDHSANIELYGNFNNYNISVTQNSAISQSFSIQQYCGISSCNPSPLIVNQIQ